jgi:hypothetical protein
MQLGQGSVRSHFALCIHASLRSIFERAGLLSHTSFDPRQLARTPFGEGGFRPESSVGCNVIQIAPCTFNNVLADLCAGEDFQSIFSRGGSMKRFIALIGMLAAILGSTSFGQELSIGPAGGALFMQGSQGHAPGIHANGSGSSFSIGGEFVYSFSSIPLDLVGQAFYSPIEGRSFRRDSLGAPPPHDSHGGNDGSLFSLGLGGRWVPLRGPVSPYLGLSLLISHQEGGHRPDSTEASQIPVGNPPPADHPEYYGDGGGVTRFGVGVSVGSEFVFSDLIRLDVGASYSMNSPFERGRNLSTIGFGASVLFTLF